jgi:hypothetical protein
MWFFLNSFSYSPHLTVLRYSQTRSSSQFLGASEPSSSENSEEVGLAKEAVLLFWMAGVLRVEVVMAGEIVGMIGDVLEPSWAGKAALGASMAISSVGCRWGAVYSRMKEWLSLG